MRGAFEITASRRVLASVLAAGLGLAAQSASATVYTGNGATGFGGPIGNSTLTVTDGGATINFSLATASGFAGGDLAIYLDTLPGVGATSTSTFTDTGDVGRMALSGLSTSGRTLAVFSPGFGADYGISVEPGNFAGVFNLSTPTAFGFVESAGLDPAATNTLNFAVDKALVGLPTDSGSFSFEASLLSGTIYRSNETIGTSATAPNPLSPTDAPNAGFTGTTTFAAGNTFTYGVVPEPASMGLLGLASLMGLRRKSR